MPPEHIWAYFGGKRGRYADSFVKLRFTLAGLDVYRIQRQVSQL